LFPGLCLRNPKTGVFDHWLIEDVVGEGHAHVIGVLESAVSTRLRPVSSPVPTPYPELRPPSEGGALRGKSPEL